MRGSEIRKTPLVYSPTFSSLSESKVYLKTEFQQKTGSFKLRGAYYKIKSLSDEEKKHGVVAASAGNHAQGVAFASESRKDSMYNSYAKKCITCKSSCNKRLWCKCNT